MKIIISTTPIRPVPCDHPPFGSMAVIGALRAAGYDPYFYDIDVWRYPFEEVERFFAERQPDVLGISAVVSTAYAYTKRFARMVRRVSPKTRIVLGGNLAASAEILHRLAGIDYCVIGEGEIVSASLMNYLRDRLESGLPGEDYEALSKIKGISYLEPDGTLRFTGYESRIPADDLADPDYSILERYSKVSNYIKDPMTHPDFAQDPRSLAPHRKGQRMATLITAKGCVARCTFCHRFDKGYRALNVEGIRKMVAFMKERYNVGFFQFGDENFGSDRRQVDDLIAAVKPLDILFNVCGIRCRTVDLPMLRRLKEAGAVAVYYGMETGSPRILEVMEKNSSLEHNLNAALWTQQAGLYTVYQLVVGMPGENEETIRETIEFFKKATEILPEPPINRMSINYIQALPGTPVYEWARHKGLVGRSLLDEEAYLIHVSDVNAADDTKFLNFTDYDYLTVQSWRRRMILECTENYIRKNRLGAPSLRQAYQHTLLRWLNPAAYERLQRESERSGMDYDRGGYFNLQRGLYYDIIATRLYALRAPILWLWLLARERQRLGPRLFLAHVWDALRRRLFPPGPSERFQDYRSLRKVVDSAVPMPSGPTELAMAPMRAGR